MKRTLCFLAFSVITTPLFAFACPKSKPLPSSAPLGIAASETSTVKYTLSNLGLFRVTRTLTSNVPITAVSCLVTLEGRFSRKGNYSKVRTLGTKSSTATTVRFTARGLPSVRTDKVDGEEIQPSLHLRVVTECVDGSNTSVFSDTTPVVARYADCGSSKKSVAMLTFISRLINKLKN